MLRFFATNFSDWSDPPQISQKFIVFPLKITKKNATKFFGLKMTPLHSEVFRKLIEFGPVSHPLDRSYLLNFWSNLRFSFPSFPSFQQRAPYVADFPLQITEVGCLVSHCIVWHTPEYAHFTYFDLI